jgi:quercetin dioxygenase-like cupin family protein
MATRTTLNTEQEALWYLGNLRIIQAIGEQAGRAVHLTEYVLPAGTHIYAHRHRDEDEGVYVAEGEATFSCGEKVMSATAGTLLFLPQNVHHHLEVGKSAPFRYLTWMTATGFAHNVLHLSEPGQALVLSPPPFASQERIQQLAMLLRNATTPSLEDF